MILKIDTDKMKCFPKEAILVWCNNWNMETRRCCRLRQRSECCGLCQDGIIKGKLASASPIKRWLFDIATSGE